MTTDGIDEYKHGQLKEIETDQMMVLKLLYHSRAYSLTQVQILGPFCETE